MSETKIEAEVRESFGKGAARKLRAAQRTPAVIYGHGNATRHIHMPAHEVALALRIKNALLEIKIAVEVKKGEKVHVEVPVHIVGEPMGGTVVDLEHKTVKVEAEATHIPQFIELEISKENPAGHHYNVSDLSVPDGVIMELASDELVASVVETRAGVADEEPAAETEAAEGEEPAAAAEESESAE